MLTTSTVNYLSTKVAVVGVSLFLSSQCYAQLPVVADETRITTCAKMQTESAPTRVQVTNAPSATCTNGHSVTLSWKASPSLSPTYNKGEGYIVYRWNKTTDGWCGKIEQVESTTYVDCKVGAGQTYRYAVTAFQQSGESKPTNAVEAVVP